MKQALKEMPWPRIPTLWHRLVVRVCLLQELRMKCVGLLTCIRCIASLQTCVVRSEKAGREAWPLRACMQPLLTMLPVLQQIEGRLTCYRTHRPG